MPGIDVCLREVMSVPGARGAALVDWTCGLSLGSAGEPPHGEAESAAAEAAELARMSMECRTFRPSVRRALPAQVPRQAPVEGLTGQGLMDQGLVDQRAGHGGLEHVPAQRGPGQAPGPATGPAASRLPGTGTGTGPAPSRLPELPAGSPHRIPELPGRAPKELPAGGVEPPGRPTGRPTAAPAPVTPPIAASALSGHLTPSPHGPLTPHTPHAHLPVPVGRLDVEDLIVTTRTEYHVLRFVETEFDASVFLHMWLDRDEGNLAVARLRLQDVARRLVLE